MGRICALGAALFSWVKISSLWPKELSVLVDALEELVCMSQVHVRRFFKGSKLLEALVEGIPLLGGHPAQPVDAGQL